MVAPRILWRYLLRDVFLHALLGLTVIVLVLLVQNTLRFLERLFDSGVGGPELLQLGQIILANILPYALPTSLLFGVLTSFGRMSADGEIIAMRAAGLSVYRLLPPVLLLGVAATACTSWLVLEIEPRSQATLKILLRQVGQLERIVRPGSFVTLGEQTVYVGATGDSACPLRGILIGDFSNERRARYVAARCGSIEDDEESSSIAFVLTQGSIHFGESESDRYRRIRFADGRTQIDLERYLNPGRRAREHTIGELRQLDARFRAGESPELRGSEGHVHVRLQMHRRFAFALASIAFVLLAVPLGIQPLRTGRSWGALTAIGVMASYWLGLTICERVAEAGVLPPLIVWMPNALVIGLAVLLLRRSQHTDA